MTDRPAARNRRLVSVIAWIVPASERDTWRREWDAELAYAERADTGSIRRADRPPARRRPAAWSRLMAAFQHALWLRGQSIRFATAADDLRHAARLLAHRPAFAAAVVVTLALGIGGTTVIFSAMRAVFWRPLPFPDPDALVMVSAIEPTSGTVAEPDSASAPDFLDWRDQGSTFSGMAAVRGDSAALRRADLTEQVSGSSVTGDFFPLFGVVPAAGRTLEPSDTAANAPAVVVLSHALWQRRFGGSAGVIGSTAVFDGEPRQVVGVMPRDFSFPLGAEFWMPLRFTERDLTGQRGAHYLTVVGRLRPGAALATARAEMAAVGARLAAAYPRSNRNTRISVVPLREALVGNDVRAPMQLLSGAVAVVFLIACVNVSSLVLGLAIGRRRDLAVRAALGASRVQLARGLFVEHLLLAAMGGALGLGLAAFGARAIALFDSIGIARLDETRIDGPVALFAVAATLVAALLVGIAPAWHAARRSVAHDLTASGTRTTHDPGRVRTRSVLVVAEIGLAAALLVGAGLLARSFLQLSHTPLGLDPRGVQTFSLLLPDATYGAPPRRAAFLQDILARVTAQADVQSAGAIFGLPLSDFSYYFTPYERDGARVTSTEDQNRWSLQVRVVTPGYFRTMGIPVLHGRPIEADDRDSAPKVAVINAAAARALWPDTAALGHRITVATRMGLGGDRVGGEIVGVVGDTRDAGPATPARPTLYLPHAQAPVSFFTLVVRPRSDRGSLAVTVRSLVAAIDPAVPVFRVRTMDEFAARALAQPRLYLALLGLFAAVAMGLAVVGIYGVMAQNVSARVREIGVRIALGATPAGVVGLVVGRAGRLALIGLGAGFGLALAARPALASVLYGVRPADPMTYGAVCLVTLVVVIGAAWLPARRAARVDPVNALRAE